MKKIVNIRKGFTLAEILISLVILGVIAALTIPSLIQNTHKKEEVVKIKKGLSVINQAITMDKVLTGEDLSQYRNEIEFKDMLKKRMSVVSEVHLEIPIMDMLITQDGLGYVFSGYFTYNPELPLADNNYRFHIVIVSNPEKLQKDCADYANLQACNFGNSTLGNFDGTGSIYCGYDRCVPSEGTAAILNASDPTKVDSGS